MIWIDSIPAIILLETDFSQRFGAPNTDSDRELLTKQAVVYFSVCHSSDKMSVWPGLTLIKRDGDSSAQTVEFFLHEIKVENNEN